MATAIRTSGRVRKARREPVNAVSLPVIEPDACGIDMGAEALCAAVPADRDPEPVRTFSTFTQDLLRLAEWLKLCKIRSVAIEATGVYWIPLFQVLIAAGFEVCVVNPRHVKHVRGRKTDVSDCQWLQFLHSVGLLKPSFRPADAICILRTLYRQREHLVQHAAEQIQMMQKSFDQMNIHLHHVLSDLAGVSGQRIVAAILAGERDPVKLVGLCDSRVKADYETLVAALTGDWRAEHLFTLRQAHQTFEHYHTQLRTCDQEIENWMRAHPAAAGAADTATSRSKTRKVKTKRPRNEPVLPTLDLRKELHQRFGVDLVAVPSLGLTTVLGLYAEVGADLSAFPSGGHFVSWLALCPNPHKSGGKVLHSHTREVQHRVARIFRQAAQSQCRADGPFGDFYRRIRGKLGGPQAVTATAHKMARVFYHLVTTQQEYDESIYELQAQKQRDRRLKQLQRQAKAMGFTLNPVEVS